VRLGKGVLRLQHVFRMEKVGEIEDYEREREKQHMKSRCKWKYA
jgi:hypothetical protein